VPVEVDVRAEALSVRICGADRWWALSSGVELAWDEVRSATVTSFAELRPTLGWRVGGTYWPGRIAAGWYTVRGQRGQRQLWLVRRDRDQLLVVDTTRHRPCRLVLAVPDAMGSAAQIAARVA
jgi:hypothetical protein